MIIKISYILKLLIGFMTFFLGVQSIRLTNMLKNPRKQSTTNAGNNEQEDGCSCVCDKDIYPFGPTRSKIKQTLFYIIITIGILYFLYYLYNILKS